MRKSLIVIIYFAVWTGACAQTYNPPERIMVVRPTFEGHTERPLRYRPDDTDFVIENGTEFYNRPLYGGNTAFRVDAGDKPEFSLYLPGHGGNMRFGMRTAEGAKWLQDADRIVSRYRPGAMLYEIHDALLKESVLHVTVIGLYEADGLIVRAALQGSSKPVEWIAAYGGASGKRGKRSGDIGCESQPISEFFKLIPQNCQDNSFTINENTYHLESKIAEFAGVFPAGATLAVADAEYWNQIGKLLESTGRQTETPVLAALVTLPAAQPVYTVLQRTGEGNQPITAEQLPSLFESTERQRRQIAQQVTVDTPDAYINAAVSALCVAADAIWDEKQASVMHGAVAWRSKYLGWRGPYANDALGRHDRAKKHFSYWATQQNKKEIPGLPQGGDADSNYARSHSSKQTAGDIGGKHYDMNLVYMDALFRHILWTGDLELAEQLWPVIERHMAWERRLFRRQFGEDKLPLYEAYAAIWASDDLQYHGGGVTHTSAYNDYHNRMLAKFAKALGKDPAPFKREAERIRKGMQKYLWLQDRGWYAEFRDLLGLQKTHPSAALWTFYHTLDAEAADPLQAWQMTRFVDTQFPHIPVYGGEIPKGRYFTLPTTTWMPYTWSTNNVVMAEVAHTALAYWQAQRPQKAFALFKGCILDSMYMGRCPGNAGMTTYFDMARGEAQRDFGDAVGTCSRALIEGLFGIRPDIPAGVLKISPGFPDDWTYAKLTHPDILFDYEKQGNTDRYAINPAFASAPSLELKIKARGTGIQSITHNSESINWAIADDAVGCPSVLIQCEPSMAHKIEIEWSGPEPANAHLNPVVAEGASVQPALHGAVITEVIDPQNALKDADKKTHSLTAKAVGTLGHRTAFARLRQGQMHWTEPVEFEIRKAFEILSEPQTDPDSIRFRVRNNTAENVDTKVSVRIGTRKNEMPLQVPAYEMSPYKTLTTSDFHLLPGSNRIHIDMGEGRTCEGIVTNWHIQTEQLEDNTEPLDLNRAYNDSITHIFQNEYLSPRSPYCSLAIPKQGIGSWCNFAKTFEVDDSGLVTAAKVQDGLFILPQGIPFSIPIGPQSKNTVLTSQWDNYPEEIAIPLSGRARHLYLLMAGSTNSMQSRFDNGEVIVTYTDGSEERLVLRNPTTWWPIDQDYFIDDFGFKRPEPLPPRVDLKTARVRILDIADFKGKGGTIPGGAATVLDLPLATDKDLQGLEIRALANEVVIGLMGATLIR